MGAAYVNVVTRLCDGRAATSSSLTFASRFEKEQKLVELRSEDRHAQKPPRRLFISDLPPPSVLAKAALLYYYPLNHFLLPEAEGRGEREAPKRTFLSVLP